MLRVFVTALFMLSGTVAVAGGHEDPSGPGNSGNAPGRSGDAPGQSGGGGSTGGGSTTEPVSDTAYTGGGSDVEYYTLTAEDYELADEILALMLLLGEDPTSVN